MESILLLLYTIALALGVPLLLLCMFYLPEYFRVDERVQKAREDFKNSDRITGIVIRKSTEFLEKPDEISMNFEKSTRFDVQFDVNGLEQQAVVTIIEQPKSDWFTRLFEPKIQASYEPVTNTLTAFYNRVTREIKSLEEMEKSLHEHSCIYYVFRFYLLLMMVLTGVALIGLVVAFIVHASSK